MFNNFYTTSVFISKCRIPSKGGLQTRPRCVRLVKFILGLQPAYPGVIWNILPSMVVNQAFIMVKLHVGRVEPGLVPEVKAVVVVLPQGQTRRLRMQMGLEAGCNLV